MQTDPFKARRQRTVADNIDNRRAEVLATCGQRGVGHAELDVGQTQFAPLVDRITVGMGEGAVGAASNILAVTVENDGVVSGNFGAHANGALGEARGVVDDGALNPVDTTRGLCSYRWRGVFVAVFHVAEAVVTTTQFIGVPVTGCAAQALSIDKAFGLALGATAGQCGRDELLTCRFCVRRGGDAANGQGQYRGAAQFHG
ncbi:hypothetical protein D3C81_1204610 [compost metagenome]